VLIEVPALGAVGLPRVFHWGNDLGAVDKCDLANVSRAVEQAVPRNALDDTWPFTLLPSQADGWLGRAGFSGQRSGHVLYPRWDVTQFQASSDACSVVATDEANGLTLHSRIFITPGGLIGIRHRMENTGDDDIEIARIEALLPVPDVAREMMDFTGRWSKERFPQRSEVLFGAHVRESRRGRTGHDAATVLYVGTPGFSNRRGEVWGVHVGTSGNHVHAVEKLPEGAGGSAVVLGGGELLEPGEVVLAPGCEYESPIAWFVHSAAGLDGAAARFHDYLRARPAHPRSPRPLVLNTWEAVYLDHDAERLFDLADRAAFVGVERFVLDDGWFHGRAGTTRRGLGDWWVDDQTWPDGLGQLIKHVRSLGMDFGLWVEPEMVNPDSELVRQHPGWVLADEGRWPRIARHQLALDLAIPEASDYLFERLSALVEEHQVAFLKWDHNRDIHESLHAGRAGTHGQTLALYALLARIRTRFPALEIESCASGGGRIDLGIIDYMDRVWVSDTNDPLERQRIQRWTSQLIPLELQGCHIGPSCAHTTGRRSSLSFRAMTALFGHAGIEWDLAECTEEELEVLRAFSRLYRELRALIHHGTLVHPDHADENALLTGVVSPDRTEAAFVYARLDTSVAAAGERLRLCGLTKSTVYRVEVRRDLGEPASIHVVSPRWMADPIELSGSVLEELGLAAPQLVPQEAMLITATEVRARGRRK